ncbi:MAG: transketolase family protein [Nitrospiraceae bacterium]|nr:transketolase family protein [Nitrospiraceae bacterium]
MGMQNQRRVYGETLEELGSRDERIVVLEADLRNSTMTALFQRAFPERHFEVGIAEANMAGIAAGLALTGKIPFVNSFATFAAGRAYDQIRQAICIGNLNVNIVGSSAGLSDFGDGATHQAVEDIAIMRAIPNMTVLAPADGNEVREMVGAMAAHDGPVYMRLNRNDVPDALPAENTFRMGTPVVIRDGKDLVVFAHGIMVSRAVQAANILAKEGVSVRVVNVSTLKPLDEAALLDLAQGFQGVLVTEEHSIVGGLTALAAYVLRGQGLPLESVAISDVFGQSAHSHEELLEHYGLTAARMVETARAMLRRGA